MFNYSNQEMLEITFDDFKQSEIFNEKLISEFLKSEIKIFEDFFNVKQHLWKSHIWSSIMDPYCNFHQYEIVAIHAYCKVINLLYDCHSLSLKGQIGAVRVLQRQAFEFVILGKYMTIKKDDNQANLWLIKGNFNVYNDVIKRLESSTKNALHEFWKVLCNYNHATPFSYQIGRGFEYNKENIYESYYLTLILLRWNYHLLGSCLINHKHIYRANTYGDKSLNEAVRINARGYKSFIYGLFNNNGKQLIKSYESKWKWMLREKDFK